MADKDTSSDFSYIIAADDTIVFVDQAWISFAHENDTPHLTAEFVLHRPIWEFITDRETRHLYQIMISKVRETGDPITLPFRCDAPECRRFMEMEISLVSDGAVRFDTHVQRQELREPVTLLDPKSSRSDKFLTLCSWCKKALLPSKEWVEAEEAVARLSLFSGSLLPQLTHGMCPACSETFHKTLNGLYGQE
jgi:hypothetical protein